MATKNIVPRTGSEGEVGTSAKPWSKAHIDELTSSIGVNASYFFGDGAGLTNLSTTIEEVLTAGNVATTPFTGSGIRVDDIGNTTLSITANSGDLNLSSSADINLDLAGGDFKVEGGRVTVGTSGVNVDILQKGNLSVIGTATLPVVSSSVGVSGAFFQGDGSGLTGVTGDWDGQHTGDAGITGSLEVLGQLSASLGITGSEVHTPTIYATSFHAPGIGSPTYQISNAGVFIYNDLSVGLNANPDTFVVDRTEQKVGVSYNIASLPDAQFSVSGSTKFGELSTDTHQFTGSVSFISGSGDLLTMDDTNAPPTPTAAAHLYAKSGEMFVMDTAGNETQISPHDEEGEWQYFSRNTKTGKVVRIRMEKMIRKLEELTGDTFIEEE
jgi:hypothetical protein